MATATKKLAVVDKDTCAGCEACVPACPVSAISMSDNIAVIDASKCDGCATCKEQCPTEAISMKDR
jgi:Fe-S-cluster-containing hydrogenase component 2